jgi:hypothetical protein
MNFVSSEVHEIINSIQANISKSIIAQSYIQPEELAHK